METISLLNATISQWYSQIYPTKSAETVSGSAAQNQGDSVILSDAMTIDIYQYSAQGTRTTLSALSDTSDQSAAQSAGQNESASETDAALSITGGNYRAKYLEIIKNRVKFLLEAIASANSDGNSNSGSENVTSAADASSGVSSLTDSGYWSPEQTAQRIVGFALSFYDGGDREEYAAMVKDAVMKGFQEAQNAMGGSLPDISNKTISLAIDAIDQFASGSGVDVTA